MRIIILGAGGHARVVADALIKRNKIGDDYEISGFLDDDEELHDQEQLGVRIIGKISDLKKFEHDGVAIAIGDNATRQKLYLELKNKKENIITVIHPCATIARNVIIGEGTVVSAGVVVSSGAHIGSNVILNTSCSVDHDSIVGSHVHVCPGAHLGGTVTIEEGAFIGIGSAVIQNVKIGKWAIVGARSAVIKDVADFSKVVGVPSAPLQKRLTKDKSSIYGQSKSISKGSSEIIQADNIKKWQEIMSSSYQYDFYHTLEYHLITSEIGGEKPILFVYQDSISKIALPLLLRQVHKEEWFSQEDRELYDVTSVYGYTGPISSQKNLTKESIANFSNCLMNTLHELKVVSLFTRLHPLIGLELYFDNFFRRRIFGETVSIDLTIPSEEQVLQFCDNHRRGIKKLKKGDFICYEDVNLQHLDDFFQIYSETMDRVEAKTSYYFPKKYFSELLEKLNGIMHLFVCIKNNQVISAGIFSLCKGIIQYHLGGTKNSYLMYSPMKLLFDAVREWGMKNQASVFHLGGGFGSSKDSLMQFKSGFSKRRHPYAVWEKVINPEDYKYLCDIKDNYNKKNNYKINKGSFFPLYRSECEMVPSTTMKKTKIAIYGAGGFGRELAWLIKESSRFENNYEYVGFIDDNPDQVRHIEDGPVFTLEDAVRAFPDARVLIAVGIPSVREKLAKKVLEAGLAFEIFVHPSVTRSSSTDLGVGSIVCAGCILTTNIIIKQHAVILFNSTIGHDGIIGDYSIIGPRVCIAGTVNIGKRVFVGAGTTIINGTLKEPIFIGDDTVIGAGSCVIRSLPAGSHVFGNPARPIPKI